jgi:hypothetical protein
MLLGVGMLLFMLLSKGHPSSWRLGQRWVEAWGGDWKQVQSQIAMEAFYREQMIRQQQEELEKMRAEREQTQQSQHTCDEADGGCNTPEKDEDEGIDDEGADQL